MMMILSHSALLIKISIASMCSSKTLSIPSTTHRGPLECDEVSTLARGGRETPELPDTDSLDDDEAKLLERGIDSEGETGTVKEVRGV